MGGRMVVKLTTMMTFAFNMTDLWLGCRNQKAITNRFERIKAISKTPCPHVVVFYFYTKMSKVIPSVAGMSLPSNFYKSLLFLDSLERGTRSGRAAANAKSLALSLPPPPSFTYTFRRTVRIVGFLLYILRCDNVGIHDVPELSLGRGPKCRNERKMKELPFCSFT